MLKGYDISNHQAAYGVDYFIERGDFVILKATEGLTYKDAYFREWANRCVEKNYPFGFYHYAKANDAKAECEFFMNVSCDFNGLGIPVLDWEESQNVAWVNTWVETYFGQTGIWPWIYANPWRFNQGGVNPNCGRWVAAYQSSPPSADQTICAWQYTSTPFDTNYFYGDVQQWNQYVRGGEKEDMTDAQAALLQGIYDEVKRTDDPTGRGYEMLDHDHIKWIAAAIQEINEKLSDAQSDIDALIALAHEKE